MIEIPVENIKLVLWPIWILKPLMIF